MQKSQIPNPETSEGIWDFFYFELEKNKCRLFCLFV
jgi:hypothetical protein